MRRSLQERWIAAAVGAAAVASLAFQQSPGNEAVRGAAGFRVLDTTSNPVAVGLAVAAITVVIDGTTSVLIALGLHADIGVVQRLMDWSRDRLTTKGSSPSHGTSLATDVVLCLAVGAGLVVVRRHLHDDQRRLPSDLALAGGATLFVAVVAGVIAYLAAGGLEHADAVGLGTPARWMVRYGADWRVWLVALLAAVGISVTRARLTRRRGVGSSERREPR